MPVTRVPKKMRHGNSMTGIQAGRGYYDQTGYHDYGVIGGNGADANGAGGAPSVSVTVNVAGHATREDAEYIAKIAEKAAAESLQRGLLSRVMARRTRGDL